MILNIIRRRVEPQRKELTNRKIVNRTRLKSTGRGARLGPPDQKTPASEPRLIDRDIHLRARIRFAIATPSVWGVTVATTGDYNSYLNEQRKHGAMYLQFNVPGAVKRV